MATGESKQDEATEYNVVKYLDEEETPSEMGEEDEPESEILE